MATDLLQAISRVFLTCTDWQILQTWKQKKDEYVADVKAHSETLFLWYSGFHTLNRVIQPALGLPWQLSGKRICLPMQETQILSLGQEYLWEEEMATHYIYLPGESHGQKNLAGCSSCSSWCCKRVRNDWMTKHAHIEAVTTDTGWIQVDNGSGGVTRRWPAHCPKNIQNHEISLPSIFCFAD